ncbi:MAG: gamma-glutamyltransferase [Bacteroidetes bacterium]|nr:gamma-glutamyltransferase [Bacteroidota bacterium]
MSRLGRTILVLVCSASVSFAQISVLKPALSRNGMVSSADSIASAVGIKIMKDGGNAVDAAVAMGFTLAVTYPQAGNLGGGGYYLVHLKSGENYAIDARETAPSRASRDMYLDSAGKVDDAKELIGGLSVGVPGNVDGLLLAEKRFGKLPLKTVMAPAIRLARKGFRVSYGLADEFVRNEKKFAFFRSTMKYFSKDGKMYRAGELLVQKDLAKVLVKISEEGRDGFYKGEIPELIAREDQAAGGIITVKDVEDYHAVVARPITVNYRGYEVLGMPPSSSGGVCLAEELNILSNFDLSKYGYGASQSLHYELEAMRRAFADRDRYLGDVAFAHVPLERLLSREYADSLARTIDPFSATPSIDIYPELIHPPHEGTHTTHYSVVDKYGNAVSVTTTLNSYFGSMVVVDGAGFFLNNEMDDFSAKPGTPNQFGAIGGFANSIQPGKRMLSSMSPTIVLKDRRPFLVLGSPGGTTIINAVLQVILNVIDYHMPLAKAVMAGRVQMQWVPDEVYYEPGALVYDVKESLISRGYRLFRREFIGEVETILVTPYGFEGVADPRGPGDAEGY